MPDDNRAGFPVVERVGESAGDERRAVVARLRADPASIAPRYFYDELGCALYGAICRLPEYYPTRTEAALFEACRARVAEAAGRGRQLVDLGAGDCGKAQAWFGALEPARYVAVDIAGDEIRAALARIAREHPALETAALVADFMHGLPLEGVVDARPAVFFYPGSSIGNFTPPEAVGFLGRVARACAERPGSSLLIGVDAKKDPRVLEAAYDDALGVTAAFNRNALAHLNRRFGFAFQLARFAHVARYDAAQGRVEMHLESACAQAVALGEGIVRRFRQGERIHTESSYKYHAAEFEALLGEAGFGAIERWSAPGDAYFVFLAR